MTLGRSLVMFALACTGVGAFYMLARLQWVSPKCVGIIINYNTQEFEELEPGIHCILNPFRSYINEVSMQTQTNRLKPFSVKSLDNVDAVVQADITYKILRPLELYNQVNSPTATFIEQVKSAFSSAIQTLQFAHVTSAEINRLAKEAGHNDEDRGEAIENFDSRQQASASASSSMAVVSQAELMDGDGIEQSQLIKDGADFFSSLLKTCKKWGIEIQNFYGLVKH
jgi:regulator of protease activity HflC (stomatin/prohibitin superfamily)